MVNLAKQAKKAQYFDKLIALVESYPQVLIVKADHVGSRQMANIRVALRGKAVILMGKNTMIRTALRKEEERLQDLTNLLPCIKLNIGLVFCITDMGEVKKIIEAHKVPAPARAGVVAPISVTIPGGPTPLGPEQTSFFQALGIATKISKGCVEILKETPVIVKDEKVGASQAALLQKLEINPFSYGLQLVQVYDTGSVYDASALDISHDDIVAKFMNAVTNVAAISQQVNVPTEASLPHMIIKAFKNAAALVLNSEYSFPEMAQLQEYLKNPEKFAGSGCSVSAAPAAEGKGKAAPAEEEEEEDDGDMGMSLFD